jgi:hypothetical protein
MPYRKLYLPPIPPLSVFLRAALRAAQVTL